MSTDAMVAAHREQAAALRAGTDVAAIELEKAATEVGRMVRTNAAARGHAVGIRVVRKSNGVRVTVTGPHAVQYRTAVERALRDKVPGASAQVRAQLTRRAK